MKDFYKKYARSRYDQNGETGIIADCFRRMNMIPNWVAEWGANDGEFCSNTLAIIEDYPRCKAILIEADKDLYAQCVDNMKHFIAAGQASIINSEVNPHNVNALIPPTCDLISIDTDGQNDYYTWQAYKGNPPIVIIEINSSYPPMTDQIDQGANYSAMVKLGISKGYFLLVHCGNLIFVRNDFREWFPEIVGDGLENYQDYFQTSWQ